MEQKINHHNATMKDVANAAGVSTATVSRAFTRPDQVSFKTRQKVEQATLKTGYDTYCLTKNTKSSKAKTIFVAIPDITSPIYPDIISGIEQVAAEQGYMVLIGDCKHYKKTATHSY
ncbi:LacI family DNA-binding transcriptional regulator [Arsenophonus sp. ENCA]|uniref:LacI family DNA-binding transcriptional regulator n=1 Tax=Arsenophonus sp. ENCA TaxID=1987579 RepID=UPI0025B8E55B|nr:LacI family DNA-binding transcriptional regulator [Arsenophonus sp. ENCA]